MSKKSEKWINNRVKELNYLKDANVKRKDSVDEQIKSLEEVIASLKMQANCIDNELCVIDKELMNISTSSITEGRFESMYNSLSTQVSSALNSVGMFQEIKDASTEKVAENVTDEEECDDFDPVTLSENYVEDDDAGEELAAEARADFARIVEEEELELEDIEEHFAEETKKPEKYVFEIPATNVRQNNKVGMSSEEPISELDEQLTKDLCDDPEADIIISEEDFIKDIPEEHKEDTSSNTDVMARLRSMNSK